VFFHIEQRNERRKKRPPLQNTNAPSRVIHLVLPPVNITKIEMPEPSLYRLAIPSRGSDGEPLFQMIPKYLFV
jgi:hypothetical protein